MPPGRKRKTETMKLFSVLVIAFVLVSGFIASVAFGASTPDHAVVSAAPVVADFAPPDLSHVSNVETLSEGTVQVVPMTITVHTARPVVKPATRLEWRCTSPRALENDAVQTYRDCRYFAVDTLDTK